MTIYSVSDAYKTAIRARTRTDRVTGTLTLTNGTVLDLDAADLMSGSLTLDNQCVTGEELAFGCAYLGQAALNLRTDLSRHAFYGAKLLLHYGLQLPGGRWETVPLGVYTVAEAERRALYVSIKAYDNILALQQKYDGTTMQGTAYALLGQIAAACGLTLGQTEAEIGALNPNAALVCQLSGGELNALMRTTCAATQMSGSPENNVLPARASVGFNLRIINGESCEEAEQRVREAVDDPDITVRRLYAAEPSSYSETYGEAWERLAGVIKSTWPKAVVSPYLMLAASDSRHYDRISSNVYRFCPLELSKEERATIHGVNERIPTWKAVKCAEFYVRLIRES